MKVIKVVYFCSYFCFKLTATVIMDLKQMILSMKLKLVNTNFLIAFQS